MPAFSLVLTTLGVNALAAAGAPGGDPVILAEAGLTSTTFFPNADLTALPGEFSRLPVTGRQADANILHVQVQDSSDAIWSCTGFGLWTDAGELFGSFSSEDIIHAKAGAATGLFQIDLAFAAGMAELIEFGDITILSPPATEGAAGVAAIATDAEMTTGLNDAKFVTPKKFATRIAALLTPFTDAINALFERTIGVSGLATGGGNLTANRTIGVPAASQAETKARAIATKAVTPDGLNGLFTLPAADGVDTVWAEGPFLWKRRAINIGADQDVAVNWATAFPNGIIFAHCEGGQPGFSVDSNNPFVVAGSATTAGCTVRGANNTAADVIVIAKGY